MKILLLLLSAFPISQGWPQRIIILHIFLSSMSISFTPTSFISSFTTSKNLLFGLPLLLFPGNSISIIFLPTYSWSLLMTCPYHLSLPSLIFIPNCSTLTVLLMCSFLILSFLVTPIVNLNIFISATSISFTCFFVTATVSSPYTIAGLTTELCTFPFTLAGNLLSQITPDTLLHPFHPACTLFFTSLSQPPLSCTVDPKYLNFLLLTLLYPPSSLFRCHFLHLCKDIRSLTYLLSSLFFPMHTAYYYFFPGLFAKHNIISKQHRLRWFSPYFIHDPVHYHCKQEWINADPWCSPTLTLKLSVLPTAHLNTVSLPSYISCTSRTYFSTIPDFLMQYHSFSRGTLS